MPEWVAEFLRLFTDLEGTLRDWIALYGIWIYAILFAIVFIETGLVVMPFLPGDSLLFLCGVLASLGEINVIGVMLVLMAAAILGDAVNYSIGYRVGPRVFRSDTSWIFHKKHLLRAQAFYERHGGKTIFLARFIPILRTFAPFVAGIGQMSYPRFAAYNVVGAIVWVATFVVPGYLFAEQPWVRKNLYLILGGIIVISLTPLFLESWWLRETAESVNASERASDFAARQCAEVEK
ncbi:MAG: DedA family protein [Gemmatales bacterium]|nr:DedA family protein [Gemmatales bacterium]